MEPISEKRKREEGRKEGRKGDREQIIYTDSTITMRCHEKNDMEKIILSKNKHPFFL